MLFFGLQEWYFCILILIQLWISPLLYTNEILTVKKDETSKVTKSNLFYKKMVFFANFVFYNSDTQQAHLYLNDFLPIVVYPTSTKDKKMRLKIEYTIFSVLTFSTIDICMKKSTNFNSIFTQRKVKKKSPFVPYVIKLFPIFHLFFLSFFEKWNQESFCVEWL